MPPDRGRASKACSSCRKGKTRCYAGDELNPACLRCQTLGVDCSLASSTNSLDRRVLTGTGSTDGNRTDTRLRHLEETVKRLEQRLENLVPARPTSPDNVSASRTSSRSRNDQAPAPVLIIRDLAAEVETGEPLNRDINSLTGEDIISQGLLSHSDAITLLTIFHEHYGRWVAFDTTSSPETLLSSIRGSDLLLCTCCLIAIRHTNMELSNQLAPTLFERAKSRLSFSLLSTPSTIEFFQAALILCMWSTTVGSRPLSIDSWLLSGFALQHCHTSTLFEPILKKRSQASIPQSHQRLIYWTIWNHLCLVHLQYCIGTRRKSMIGHSEVAKCRKILEFERVTNFQTRMVAEIQLYFCMYENIALDNVNLFEVQKALKGWKDEWSFLTEQPRSQFIQIGHDFAHLLAYERALHSKSAKVVNTVLAEMAHLSAGILKLAMGTTDDRSRHVSDHVYHMITFAAVTLCRLLNLYEVQISRTQNIVDLDNLIIELSTWLHSLGLPCHVGYTLGTVVAAAQRKLRPNAALPSPESWSTPWSTSEIVQFFPELLDAEMNNAAMNLIPDWEPFDTSELIA